MKLHPENPTPGLEVRPMVTFVINTIRHRPAWSCCFKGMWIGDIVQQGPGNYLFMPSAIGVKPDEMKEVIEKIEQLKAAEQIHLTKEDIDVAFGHKYFMD